MFQSDAQRKWFFANQSTLTPDSPPDSFDDWRTEYYSNYPEQLNGRTVYDAIEQDWQMEEDKDSYYNFVSEPEPDLYSQE